jgi:tetratricopeptide (TPR) repeat protein
MKKVDKIFHFGTRIAVSFLFLLLVLNLFYGCAAVNSVTEANHLRQAQQAFNESARLENQQRVGGLDPFAAKDMKALAASSISIQNGYASAIYSINKIYPKEKEVLRENRLLGTTLALKAMALWRIGAYDEALQTADLTLKEAADQLYPRDAAIIQAMPGLIKTDIAFERINSMSQSDTAANLRILEEEITPRLVGSDGAVNDIQRARNKVHPEHEINVYLINAQLGAYRNYQVAFQKANDGNNPGNSDSAKVEAQFNLGDLNELVNTLNLGTSGTNLVNYWKNLCLINPQKR